LAVGAELGQKLIYRRILILLKSFFFAENCFWRDPLPKLRLDSFAEEEANSTDPLATL
jgi:hypothetical protein